MVLENFYRSIGIFRNLFTRFISALNCLNFHSVCVFNSLTLSISLKRDGAEISSQEMLRGSIVGVKAIDPWNDYGELASVVHPKEVKTRPEVS